MNDNLFTLKYGKMSSYIIKQNLRTQTPLQLLSLASKFETELIGLIGQNIKY